MVTFNKKEGFSNLYDSFSVTITGGKDEYIETIKNLLFVLSNCDSSVNLSQMELYNICNLISCMLPENEQIINMDDVELLKQIKKKSV